MWWRWGHLLRRDRVRSGFGIEPPPDKISLEPASKIHHAPGPRDAYAAEIASATGSTGQSSRRREELPANMVDEVDREFAKNANAAAVALGELYKRENEKQRAIEMESRSSGSDPDAAPRPPAKKPPREV